MGIVYIEGTARGPRGEATISFLVDSGAMYTVLPQDVWQALGLAPQRRQRFSLADGTLIERDISECYIALPQGEGHSPVVLGQAGDAALLGVVTLEIFGLMLNPFTRELQPMRLMLAGMAGPLRPGQRSRRTASSSASGRVLSTVFFSTQPRRAVPTPNSM